jgi:single-strand DNA-binding protein
MSKEQESFKIDGKLIHVEDTKQISDKFQVREFVIETDERYPQMVKFTAMNERCDLLDEITVNSYLIVHFDLRGREHGGKYYNQLSAWKIKVTQAAEPSNVHEPQQQQTPEPVNLDGVGDDLLF